MLQINDIKRFCCKCSLFISFLLFLVFISLWGERFHSNIQYKNTSFYIYNYTLTIDSCDFQNSYIVCYKAYLNLFYMNKTCISTESVDGFNKNILMDNINLKYPLNTYINGYFKSDICTLYLYDIKSYLISWVVFFLLSVICLIYLYTNKIKNIIMKSENTSPLTMKTPFNPFTENIKENDNIASIPQNIENKIIVVMDDDKESIKSVSI